MKKKFRDGPINIGLPVLLAVSAQVVDEFGEPLPGSNVFVKSNTQFGTATNFDGKFSLSGVASNQILVVSYQGIMVEFNANEVPDIIEIKTTQAIDPVIIPPKKKKSSFGKIVVFAGISALLFVALKDTEPTKTTI